MNSSALIIQYTFTHFFGYICNMCNWFIYRSKVITALMLSIFLLNLVGFCSLQIKINDTPLIEQNSSIIKENSFFDFNFSLLLIKEMNENTNNSTEDKTPNQESDEDNSEWEEFNIIELIDAAYPLDPVSSRNHNLGILIISANLGKIPTPPPES